MAGSTLHKATYTQQVSPNAQTVPSSATPLTATDTLLFSIYAANKTASAVTFTVVDAQTVAKTIVPTISIPANTLVLIEWIDGVLLKGGMTWNAGTGSALDAEVTASFRSV